MGASADVGDPTDPEWLWKRLLSEEPALIQIAWGSLKEEERVHVRIHLLAMAREAGWQPGQRRAAHAALQVVDPDAERRTAPHPSGGKRKSGR
jgi:hypothetical protein